jgi:hypothetical protein
MVNLIGMNSFASVTADLRDRLIGWISRIEGGRPPDIEPAPERWSRQLRLEPGILAREYARDTSMGMNPGD